MAGRNSSRRDGAPWPGQSSAAKQRNGLRGHGFGWGSHGRGEEVEASSPRRTSAAEKELGGHCAWLATADGGANSLGKGGSTKVATGARGRSREATRLGQYLWRTDLGRHGSEAWRGDMGLLGGGGESGSGTTGGKGRPQHAGPARQSQRRRGERRAHGATWAGRTGRAEGVALRWGGARGGPRRS